MSRVEVTDLFKSYLLGGRELEVLRDISFTLEDHSFVTVVGKSGCGKTTLLRVMCNLEPASRGSVRFVQNSDNESPPESKYRLPGTPADAVAHGGTEHSILNGQGVG